MCVECLIGKQKKPILFKFQVRVTEPSSCHDPSITGGPGPGPGGSEYAALGRVATLASATQPAQCVARTGSGHARDTRYQVEGQPWVPVGSTVGPRLLGRHPWVPAQKSSTVGPHNQFSLLRAMGNQTKLSTFDTVAFKV